jgi:FAD synthase
VVTVGNFDGLHVGHREILRIVTERARARGGESAVYTFEPHPRKVLRPAGASCCDLGQRSELIDVGWTSSSWAGGFASGAAREFVRDVARACGRGGVHRHDFAGRCGGIDAHAYRA